MPTNDKKPQTRGAPSGLRWFEVHFDHEPTRDAAVKALQPLAYRPRTGWRQRTPVVVFELRATSRTVRWLVGMEERISGELPGQLQAQLPGLVLVPLSKADRTSPGVAAQVRPTSLSRPMRAEMASSVSAGVLEVVSGLRSGESAVVQWVVGPPQQRQVRPEPFSIARALGVIAVVQETAQDRKEWRGKSAEPLFAVRAARYWSQAPRKRSRAKALDR